MGLQPAQENVLGVVRAQEDTGLNSSKQRYRLCGERERISTINLILWMSRTVLFSLAMHFIHYVSEKTDHGR